MQPGDDGMMKTTIVLLRAAESDSIGRKLTPLGELQEDRFAELARARRWEFDLVLVAAHETDSWLTAQHVKQQTSEVGIKFLRHLPLRQEHPYYQDVTGLMAKYPHWPISSYIGQPGYDALTFHAGQAMREIKQLIPSNKPQRVLICSRHGHILSQIALSWVSEMIFKGFKLCSSPHLPSFPVDRGDLCCAATEFCLENGQGLVFRYDASDPANYMVGPIQNLKPDLNTAVAPPPFE